MGYSKVMYLCTGGALRSILPISMDDELMTASGVVGLKMYQSLYMIASKSLGTCALPQRDWTRGRDFERINPRQREKNLVQATGRLQHADNSLV